MSVMLPSFPLLAHAARRLAAAVLLVGPTLAAPGALRLAAPLAPGGVTAAAGVGAIGSVTTLVPVGAGAQERERRRRRARAAAARTPAARTPATRPSARPTRANRARAARPRGGAVARPARPVRAATPAPAVTAPRSAAALAGTFGAMLARPDAGQWGALVVSLTRGDTLFAYRADSMMVPASTLKMFTAALALERLGPDWRFRTEVLRDGTVDGEGTLRGHLVLRGDGDPSLSRRFHRGGYDAPMQRLAEQVAAAGIRRVSGDLVADASAFEARTIPEGWLSRYAGSGYAAPFGALSLNENIVVVAVHPDGRVLLEPATTEIAVENTVRVTGGAGFGVRVHRAVDGHVVARGTIGRAAGVRRLQLVVGDPTTFTAGALRAALAARGVTVAGTVRVAKAPAGATPVAAIVSPPLADLVAIMNRESINHFAENIFRNAARGPRRDGEGSAAAGNALLQHYARTALGVPATAVQISDGSGLSVLDRVTPRATVALLAHAHRAPWGAVFHASLPVSGESELMRHRMLGTPAVGNLHAKTGTTNEVVGLGGYVTAENGEVLAFSFLFNGASRWNARATIDAMGGTLAGFSR